MTSTADSSRPSLNAAASAAKTAAPFAASKPVRLRIALVGSEGVGKSCLIKRYCEKRFVPRYLPTVGIDYGATKISVDNREVSVHIFDTSGSRLFVDVRNEFYRDIHGIIIVFDITNRDSFDSLCEWTKEVGGQLAKDGRTMDNTVVTVCCNKCDYPPVNRQVDELEARLWAELRDFHYFETSAYSGSGIADMFTSFFSHIIRIYDEGGLPKTPVSARKVRLSKSDSVESHRHSNGHLGSADHQVQQQQQQQQPSPTAEQVVVMNRLRSGQDSWQKLGLTGNSSREEVNKVYRKLAMLLHPDKTAVKGADEAFKALGAARRNILKTL